MNLSIEISVKYESVQNKSLLMSKLEDQITGLISNGSINMSPDGETVDSCDVSAVEYE